MQLASKNKKETFDFAKDYAKKINKGGIFGIVGDLGAGKTVFVQGLAKGLGVNKKITSPTFVIMKVYEVSKNKHINKFVHIDAYRLASGDDLIAIGADEYFDDDKALVIIEWANAVKKILPAKTKLIKIDIQGENERLISFFKDKKIS